MPRPSAFCGATDVDLDELVVTPRGNGGRGADLLYTCGSSGFTKGEAERFGRAPVTEPDPESCLDVAGAEAVGSVEGPDLRPGKDAFCVVTDEGRIAWLLLEKSERDTGVYPDLTFSAKVWERRG